MSSIINRINAQLNPPPSASDLEFCCNSHFISKTTIKKGLFVITFLSAALMNLKLRIIDKCY